MLKAIISKDGWILCPIHWTKLCKLEPGKKAHGVHLWCSRCKGEVVLDTDEKEN